AEAWILGKRASVFIKDSLQLMDVVAPAAGADQHLGFSFWGVLGGKNLAHQVVWVVLVTIHALVGDQGLGSVHVWAPCRRGPATGSGRRDEK
ncbi:hypothetical protein KUT71_08875, partial [Pseudomonas aeruginosa]|uniref:hypothetical protein n=3 Tax=Pseudomonas aeruginosa TaxID=287 RepID=UPI001C3EFBFF